MELSATAKVILGMLAARPRSGYEIKTLVDSLKSAGVWAKLDALYLLAAHDAQAARLNATARPICLA